jgi:RimJ/RimL family protein N-acetyltransferase
MSKRSNEETIFPRDLSGEHVESPPPSRVPGRYPLKGKYVTLEPQEAAHHGKELYDASHSDAEALKIWDYLTYGPWSDVASYATILRQQSASLDPIFYAIRQHETGKSQGQASFLDIHAQNGVIEIGHIWFGPDLQRTSGATEALYLMLCHAMDDLGYRRMQWRCNALNAKSRTAALRLGFRFEGIFHNHLIFKGKNRDTAWYSILDSEWPEVKATIEAWLSDENFDTDGRAKTSLSAQMAKRTTGRFRHE